MGGYGLAKRASLKLAGRVAEAVMVYGPQTRTLSANPGYVDILQVQERCRQGGFVQSGRHVQAHHVPRAGQIIRKGSLRVHVFWSVPENFNDKFILNVQVFFQNLSPWTCESSLSTRS